MLSAKKQTFIAMDLAQRAHARIEGIEAEQRLQSAALSLTMRLMTRLDERLTILEGTRCTRQNSKKKR